MKCTQYNCRLDEGHPGWHAMYHYGTEQVCIEWFDGVWRDPAGNSGTYEKGDS